MKKKVATMMFCLTIITGFAAADDVWNPGKPITNPGDPTSWVQKVEHFWKYWLQIL